MFTKSGKIVAIQFAFVLGEISVAMRKESGHHLVKADRVKWIPNYPFQKDTNAARLENPLHVPGCRVDLNVVKNIGAYNCVEHPISKIQRLGRLVDKMNVILQSIESCPLPGYFNCHRRKIDRVNLSS